MRAPTGAIWWVMALLLATGAVASLAESGSGYSKAPAGWHQCATEPSGQIVYCVSSR